MSYLFLSASSLLPPRELALVQRAAGREAVRLVRLSDDMWARCRGSGSVIETGIFLGGGLDPVVAVVGLKSSVDLSRWQSRIPGPAPASAVCFLMCGLAWQRTCAVVCSPWAGR